MIKRVILDKAERLQQLTPDFTYAVAPARARTGKRLVVPQIDLSSELSDLPPPASVTALLERSPDILMKRRPAEPKTTAEFKGCIAEWFSERYGVTLDPKKEILPTLGNRAALFGLALAYLNPKEKAALPNPGYPFYRLAVLTAGGLAEYLPLRERNDYLPTLAQLESESPSLRHRLRGQETLRQPKFVFLNYPNNPTGAVADEQFYQNAVRFASDHNVLLINDAVYSELTYDFRPQSLLSPDHAKRVAVEFHSFTFTFGLSRIPLGFAVGNRDVLATLEALFHTLGSTPDEFSLQIGLAALESATGSIDHLRRTFRARRDLALTRVTSFGWQVRKPLGGPFIWIKLPRSFSSVGFARRILRKAGVVVTPGVYFGEQGEGYVRLSLCKPEAELTRAFDRIAQTWPLLRPSLKSKTAASV